MPARDPGGPVRGLLELARPVNAVAAAGLTVIGAYVAGGLVAAPLLTAIAATATGLGTAAGNAINDYFDRVVDRHNQPGRPIPRGAVRPRTAVLLSTVLFAVALGITVAFLPLLAIAVGLANLVALVAYTPVFKGTPGLGNALVAYLGGSAFLFGAVAVGPAGPVLVLFGLAALATLAREIVKDIEDVSGDRSAGLSTLPVAIGERRTVALARLLLVVGVALSPLPYLFGTFGLAYLAIVFPADGLALFAAFETRRRPRRSQRLIKYGMFLAAVAFVIGRASLGLT